MRIHWWRLVLFIVCVWAVTYLIVPTVRVLVPWWELRALLWAILLPLVGFACGRFIVTK